MVDDPSREKGSAACSETAGSGWFVYMLKCADGSLYTGVTTDPQRRLREHNGELVGGARYTRARRPVALVYSEPCADRSAAGRREAAIKASSRQQKLALLASCPKAVR